MDDVELVGTVTASTCVWEHLAVVRGRKLLLDKRCGLAAIDKAALLQGGFEIRHAPPDGYCALHSVSLGKLNKTADPEILQDYRVEMQEECIHEVFGDYWDGEEEVSHEAEGKLAKLGFTGGVRCKDAVLGGRRRKTIAEVIASIPDQTGKWLSVSQLALVSFGTETNLAVWEAKVGGGIQLYENEGVLGLFICCPADDKFVHLLYNSGGCSLEGLAHGRHLVRDTLGANGAPVTHCHFDNMKIPPQSLPFLPAYQPSPMNGMSPSDTKQAAGGGSGSAWAPGFSEQVPRPTAKAAILSVDTGGDTATTGRTPPPPLQDADSTPPTTGPSEKEANDATAERCSARYANGKRKGDPCDQPVKAGCGEYCGLHKGRNVPRSRQSKRQKKRTGDRDGEVAQYETDPEGCGALSDDGSEAEYPGNGTDYSGEDPLYSVDAAVVLDQQKAVAKVAEPWGRKALRFMFSLVNATAKVENDRLVSNAYLTSSLYYID